MTELHENVHVVSTPAEARRIAAMLMEPAHRGRVFGADTEVSVRA